MPPRSNASQQQQDKPGRRINPEIVSCLEEALDRVKGRKGKYEFALLKALRSVENYPNKLYSGKHARILSGVGEKMAETIDRYLRDHKVDLGQPPSDVGDQVATAASSSGNNNGDESSSETSEQPKKKKERAYNPKYKSAAWAILIALYRNSKEKDSSSSTKSEIIAICETLTDTSMDKPSNGGNYTGWSSMKTLINKDFVKSTQSRPAKFSLTKKGRSKARLLHGADKETSGKTFSFEETEDEMSASEEEEEQEVEQEPIKEKTKKKKKQSKDIVSSQTNEMSQSSQTYEYDGNISDSIFDDDFISSSQQNYDDVSASQNSYSLSHHSVPKQNNKKPCGVLSDDDDDDLEIIEELPPKAADMSEQLATYLDENNQPVENYYGAKTFVDLEKGFCYLVQVTVDDGVEKVFDSIFDIWEKNITQLDGQKTAHGFVLDTKCPMKSKDLFKKIVDSHVKNLKKSAVTSTSTSTVTLSQTDENLNAVEKQKKTRKTKPKTKRGAKRKEIPEDEEEEMAPPSAVIPTTASSATLENMPKFSSPVVNFKEFIKTYNPPTPVTRAPSNMPNTDIVVSLIIDQRERTGRNDRKTFCETLVNRGIQASISTLGVGDMIWLADAGERSYVLDFIIERKEISDLASSIKDKRYKEQKYRLKQTGCNNIFYLIEKEFKDQDVLPITTLESSLVKIASEGISVKHTVSLEASINFLVQMHREISQLIAKNGLDPYLLLVPNPQDGGEKYNPTIGEYNSLFAKNRMKITNKDILGRQLTRISGCTSQTAQSIIAYYPTHKDLRNLFAEKGELALSKHPIFSAVPNVAINRIGSSLSKKIYDSFH